MNIYYTTTVKMRGRGRKCAILVMTKVRIKPDSFFLCILLKRRQHSRSATSFSNVVYAYYAMLILIVNLLRNGNE